MAYTGTGGRSLKSRFNRNSNAQGMANLMGGGFAVTLFDN